MIGETLVTFAASESVNGGCSENGFPRWAIPAVADLGRSVGLCLDGSQPPVGSGSDVLGWGQGAP